MPLEQVTRAVAVLPATSGRARDARHIECTAPTLGSLRALRAWGSDRNLGAGGALETLRTARTLDAGGPGNPGFLSPPVTPSRLERPEGPALPAPRLCHRALSAGGPWARSSPGPGRPRGAGGALGPGRALEPLRAGNALRPLRARGTLGPGRAGAPGGALGALVALGPGGAGCALEALVALAALLSYGARRSGGALGALAPLDPVTPCKP